MRHVLTPVEPAWPLGVDELPHAVVEQVRRATVRGAGDFDTAYDKQPVEGPVHIGTLGLDGDERTQKHHSGPDRAVMHCDADHLEAWREELPDLADLMVDGSFGENLVTHGLNEWNLCVGDVVEVGTCRLQVTMPRTPCHKIGAHFGRPDMALLVQSTGRTGWLYRVLQEGEVQAGDVLRVVERPCPQWPLARVAHHLFTREMDVDAARELAALEPLASHVREKFAARVESGAVESFASRLRLTDDPSEPAWRLVTVTDVEPLSDRLVAITLAGDALPRWKPGAHVTVQVANGGWRNDYSLCGPLSAPTWRIVVALDEHGHGGSRYLARHTAVGDVLRVSDPVNHFPVHRRAPRHVFLAGGVGATVFLPMAEQLGEQADWELHLSVREAGDAELVVGLAERFPGRVHVWHSRGASGRADLAAIVASAGPEAHVYACGSGAYLEAVQETTAGLPHRQVHFEAFAPVAARQQAFTARIAGTDEVVDVPEGTSLLTALRAAGHRVESDCETGSCAMCVVRHLSGDLQHHDLVLTPQQRETEMCSCVSRALGELVVELPGS